MWGPAASAGSLGSLLLWRSHHLDPSTIGSSTVTCVFHTSLQLTQLIVKAPIPRTVMFTCLKPKRKLLGKHLAKSSRLANKCESPSSLSCASTLPQP